MEQVRKHGILVGRMKNKFNEKEKRQLIKLLKRAEKGSVTSLAVSSPCYFSSVVEKSKTTKS